MKTTTKTIIKSVIKKLLYLLPIQKNKIVFVSYDFKGYGENLKYIAEEIIHQGLPLKLVWIVRDDYYVPPYIKKVYFQGVTWFYELSTAGVIVSNTKSRVFRYYDKKKYQYYLQTWHGHFPLKLIEKENENYLPSSYIALSKKDSAATNAVLSGNKQFTKILIDSFWLPDFCSILEIGEPRNDIYFKGNELKNELKLKYGFSFEDKIMLYAPTYRDDYDTSCYNIDFERLIRFLNSTSGNQWKIIIRMHNNATFLEDKFYYHDDIINGTVYSDQQELCMISDCLITDYSSIISDFMLMKKPIFLYVSDLDKYSSKETGRGLRDTFYRLPFTFNRTQDELESRIASFDKKQYNKQLEDFVRENYCFFDDGHASEYVVKHLKDTLKL